MARHTINIEGKRIILNSSAELPPIVVDYVVKRFALAVAIVVGAPVLILIGKAIFQ